MNPGSEVPPLLARVLPNVTGIDKEFDYLVPDALRDQVRVGAMVRVPLAGRRIGGWVIALGPADVAAAVAPDRLKPIAKVSGNGPAPDVLELARWAAHRWAGRVRPILASASPHRAVRVVPQPHHTFGGDPVPSVVDGLDAMLAAGGGLVRRPPTSDPVPLLLQARAHGPLLVVEPSVDTAQLLAARLRAAGCSVALLPRDWAAASGGVDVVIGARAAVWGPVTGCRVIVVLDEQDEALQEERNPTWHARDVAIERARRLGIACLLVASAPSLAGLAWAGSRVRRPSRSEERAGWPVVDIQDRSDEPPWVTSLLSSRLIEMLRDHDRRVVCVLNTPGRARRLACRSCRELTVCEHCASAVRQATDGMLLCDRCGTSRPAVCQACGASALTVLRPGVSRLREELEAAAGRPVVEVTAALPDDQPVPEADVYVGTEAVLHRVHDADVVAFLDFDAELLAPRFRATEQAMALLVRAARLVGPRADGGRIIVQTRLAHHDVLGAALFADPGRLVESERSRRRSLGFPPFAAIASLSGSGTEQYAASLRGVPELAVLGGDERVLVRAADWATLADGLASVVRPVGSRVRVEVDPPRI
ncbi:MAG: hypothetical protein AB7Q42_06320 [Acidimicrobiia bacterium]